MGDEDAPNSTANKTEGDASGGGFGGDVDQYGCIASAGFHWCAPLNRCFRPWEEKCEAATDAPMSSTTDASMPGSDRDPHGCIPSAGYRWCAALDKCLRPFEEECDVPNSTGNTTQEDEDAPNSTANKTEGEASGGGFGGDVDQYGCIASAGFHWCAPLNKCFRPWEEKCEAATDAPMSSTTDAPMPGSDRDPHGCILSAGYRWCATLEKCLRSFEEGCDSWTEAPIANSSDTTTPTPSWVGGDGPNATASMTLGDEV